MRIKLLSLLLVMALPPAALAQPGGDAKYTLEDLRALAGSESWSELLGHLEDIRPSERKAEWKGLLEKAASGFLRGLSREKKQLEAPAAADSLLGRFSQLRGSKVFMQARMEVGLEGLSECFKDSYASAECVRSIDDFAKVDPADTDLAFRAGKVIVEVGKMRASGAPLFASALAAKKARGARCKDPAVKESVLDGIGHPPDHHLAKAVIAIAFDHCYIELKQDLLEAFYRSSSYSARNLCGGLTKRKAPLTAFQSAFCKDELAKS